MRRSSTRSLANRVGNSAKRATLEKTNEDPLWREVDLKLFHEEEQQGIEHIEPYGLAYRPKSPTTDGGKKRKAEAVVVFVGDNQSHGIAVVIGDRRYRLKGLKEGEVALYDDQGQKVHLTRDGVVVDTPKKVTVTAQDDVTVTTTKKALVKGAQRAAIGDGNVYATVHGGKVHLGVSDPDGSASAAVMTDAGPSTIVFAEL